MDLTVTTNFLDSKDKPYDDSVTVVLLDSHVYIKPCGTSSQPCLHKELWNFLTAMST